MARSKNPRGLSPRHVRKILLARWMVVADMLGELELDLRGAPKDTFGRAVLSVALASLSGVRAELEGGRPAFRRSPAADFAALGRMLRVIDHATRGR
jgi:hypothetical protein